MTTTPSPDAALPREAYTLLAQANLLRVRGRWDEAVEACMAALRLAPESASAQSLLGDIYENQGRMDDAIQWYRMALDVSPDSPADRLKLGRLLDARQQRLSHAAPREEVTAAAPQAVRPLPARPAFRDPERLLRWGAWLVVALTLLIVVLAGVAMSAHRPARSGTTITAPPVVVTAPPAPAVAQTPLVSPSPTADASEQALLQALQQDTQLSAQNIVPVGVLMDPRQSVVTLTVLCPQPPEASVRAGLLRDSVLALQAAGRVQEGRVPAWTVRCLLASPPAGAATPSTSLALVADVSPGALAALGADPLTLTAPQLLPAFHNLWWSPTLT